MSIDRIHAANRLGRAALFLLSLAACRQSCVADTLTLLSGTEVTGIDVELYDGNRDRFILIDTGRTLVVPTSDIAYIEFGESRDTLTLVDDSIYLDIATVAYNGQTDLFLVRRSGPEVEIKAAEVKLIKFQSQPPAQGGRDTAAETGTRLENPLNPAKVPGLREVPAGSGAPSSGTGGSAQGVAIPRPYIPPASRSEVAASLRKSEQAEVKPDVKAPVAAPAKPGLEPAVPKPVPTRPVRAAVAQTASAPKPQPAPQPATPPEKKEAAQPLPETPSAPSPPAPTATAVPAPTKPAAPVTAVEAPAQPRPAAPAQPQSPPPSPPTAVTESAPPPEPPAAPPVQAPTVQAPPAQPTQVPPPAPTATPQPTVATPPTVVPPTVAPAPIEKASGEVKPAPSPTPVAIPAAPAPEEKTEEVVAPSDPQELLINPSFEDWEGGVPKGWNVFGGGQATRTTDAKEGNLGVELAIPGKGKVSGLLQNINLSGAFAGRTLEISAQTKSKDRMTLVFEIEVRDAQGKRSPYVQGNPGIEEWLRLSHEVVIPEKPVALTIRFRLNPTATVPGFIDDLKIRLVR